MLLSIANLTSPSQRNLIKLISKNLEKKPILKQKIKGRKNSCGKGNNKKLTTRTKGGGVKKNIRQVNFYKTFNVTGLVLTLEHDPKRTAHIAAVFNFLTYQYFYVLAPENIKIGDILQIGSSAQLKLGHSVAFSKIPLGSLVCNIAINSLQIGKISRAAGCFSVLFSKTSKKAGIQMGSGQKRYLPLKTFATLGLVSNKLHFLKTIGKAGRAKWLNKKQTVRGVAKNPIDHYNGGGNGKKSGISRKNWRTKTSANKRTLKLKL